LKQEKEEKEVLDYNIFWTIIKKIFSIEEFQKNKSPISLSKLLRRVKKLEYRVKVA
jgi:hypothetical protein